MKTKFLSAITSIALACLFFYLPASGAAIRSIADDGKCLVTVNIQAAPESAVKSWVVEERLYGITPQTISQNGVYDPNHGIIRWGTYEDAAPRTLSYTLTGRDLTVSPSGALSADGIDETVGGSSQVTIACTPPKAAKPAFSPPSGTVTPLSASITSATTDAEIYYTTDGSIPNTGSNLYAGNLDITDATLIRAVAAKTDYRTSDVASALYVEPRNAVTSIAVSVTDDGTCLPLIRLNVTPAAGTLSWVVEARIPAGLTPSSINSQGIWDVQNRMIRWGDFSDAALLELSFKAEGDDGAHSIDITGSFNSMDEVYKQSVTVSCLRAAAPVFSPPSGTEAPVTVTITSATADAEIRYTTNGLIPDENSTLYVPPLNLTSSAVLKAIAFKTGLIPSRVSTATYPAGLPKAIVLAGGGPYPGNNLWDSTLNCALYAYRALRYKGYTRDNIYFLSADTFLDADGDGLPNDVDEIHSNAQLQYAITDWAKTAGKLLIYITNHGGDGTFRMNETEILTASVLNGWLDTLQQTMTGELIVLYDACQSGSFLSAIKPPAGKSRIVITSASSTESAYFLNNGKLSFAYQFWSIVFYGSKLKEAFNFGKDMMKFRQTALLDSDGDGIATNTDIKNLGEIIIGRNIVTAASIPLIVEVSPSQTLTGTSTADFWVKNIVSLNPIERVWAVIAPPDSSSGAPDVPVLTLDEVNLTGPTPDGTYTGTYTDFTQLGKYAISIFAVDTHGLYSQPVITEITQAGQGADAYEEDNSADTASVCELNAIDPQHHSFHVQGDEDWVKFYGLAGELYTIETINLSTTCDTAIEVYDTDGASLLETRDGEINGVNERLDWTCPAEGVYFVRIVQMGTEYHDAVTYDLKIWHPTAPDGGVIFGVVKDADTLAVINNARIKTTDNSTALSGNSGNYRIVNPAKTGINLIAQFTGYQTYNTTVNLGQSELLERDILMARDRKGDVNHDGKVDLSDAILLLKVVTGLSPGTVYSDADMNGDKRLGLEDVMLLLLQMR
jgi:hypothetical protein